MKPTTRWITGVAGTLILAFGLGCLNYTRADGIEHHREVAARHNLPAPSSSILYGGVIAVISGSTTLGYVLGRGKSKEPL